MGAEQLQLIVDMANQELRKSQVKVKELQAKVKFLEPGVVLTPQERLDAQKYLQNA